jgi:ABC-type glycerol-3-phosphate transport system permease component
MVTVYAGIRAVPGEALEAAASPSLASFRRVFEQQEFGRYFLNSLVVACGVVIVSALIAFLAATAVTRFRFRFRTTLLIIGAEAWRPPR